MYVEHVKMKNAHVVIKTNSSEGTLKFFEGEDNEKEDSYN